MPFVRWFSRQTGVSVNLPIRSLAIVIVAVVGYAIPFQRLLAQSAPTNAGQIEPIESPGVPVEIDGRPIFSVYVQIGGITPEERAEAISERIILLSKNKSVPLDAIHAE